MGAKKCVVSFKDTDGVSHSVEVEADSLYEAVALGARRLHDHGHQPGLATEISVQATEPGVTHSITLGRLQDWTGTTAKGPREKVQRERVRALLSALKG